MLSEPERRFLDAYREQGTIRGAAVSLNYTPAWGFWMARKVRQSLGGLATIREAVMADENGDTPSVSRKDFEGLLSRFEDLQDALDDLAKARRDDGRENQPAQQQQVAQRELSLKDHAKALGLSIADVEHLQEERDYGKFKKFLERLEKEEDEQAAAVGDDEKGLKDKFVDGLGGIRNVR